MRDVEDQPAASSNFHLCEFFELSRLRVEQGNFASVGLVECKFQLFFS